MNSEEPKFDLTDIIPYDTLRDIIYDLSKLTDVKVILADYKGKMLIEDPSVVFRCKEIRNSPCVGHLCDKSDAFAGLEAARLGKPLIYKCHMGAAEAVSPIIINGQYVGSILAGQAILPDKDMNSLEYIINPLKNINILTPEMQEVYKNHRKNLIPLTLEQLETISHLLFTVTNYIGEISYNNIMQKKLADYKLKLMKERNRNSELDRDLANMKLKSIQAQMNPHFLFNALNTISQQAILEEADETARLITSLSNILRKTIKHSEDIITLEDELSYIKDYLHIMKVSLCDRLQINYDIDTDYLDAQIPILTLQPYVENAIIHGIEHRSKGGILSFSMHRYHGRIIIVIDDNGVGMDKDVLSDIKAYKYERDFKNSNKSLGIKNSLFILNEFFTPFFNWDVESSSTAGTRFTLKIPYQPLIKDKE